MMHYAPLDVAKIRDLIADIQKCVKRLEEFSVMETSEFQSNSDEYGLAEHYFRRALEGVLTIGTHILSRLPVKTKDYQDIIVELGKNGIVPTEFVEKNKKLAGYRNRMVHLYWEITAEELHSILRQHVSDIDAFCEYFQEVVRNPKQFGLEVE